MSQNKANGSLAAALILTLCAFFFGIMALSVHNFVDVHITTSLSEASEENILGGVGVFQSYFDSNRRGAVAADIAALRIPPLELTEPTLEFRLLFPTQENFVADVLPVSRSLLAVLDNQLQADVSSSVLNEISAVENIQFSTCGDYASQADAAVQTYFETVQSSTIPAIITAVTNQVLAEATALIDVIKQSLVDELLFDIVVDTANQALVSSTGAVSACQNVNLNLGVSLELTDDTIRACISQIFTDVVSSAAGSFPESLLTFVEALVVDSALCANGVSVSQCLQTHKSRFDLVDTGIEESVVFTDNTSPQLCEVLSCGSGSKLDFLSLVLAPTYINSNQEGVGNALTTYIEIAGNGGTEPESTFEDEFPNLVPDSTEFNDNRGGGQRFDGCVLVTGFGFECDTLADYFEILPQFLGSLGNPVLASAVGEIFGLYLEFFEIATTVAPLALAPPGFKVELFSGAFNTAIGTSTLQADIVSLCEDDVIDNEKIATAQGLAISSAIFQGFSICFIIAAFFYPKLIYRIIAAGVLCGLLGAILIFSALAVVQSAPVYESVGSEGDGSLGIFYVQSKAPLFAAVDGFVFLVAIVFLCLAAWYTRKTRKSEDEFVNRVKAACEDENNVTL